MACISGYFPVVELLLNEGADLTIFDVKNFIYLSSYFHAHFTHYVFYN